MAEKQKTAIVAVPGPVAKQQSRVVDQATKLQLANTEDYEASTGFLKMLDEALTVADGLFDDNIKNWFAGHKAAVLQKKTFVLPFERAMQIVKAKRIEYRSIAEARRQQQEREIRDQQAKLQQQQLEEQAKTLEQAGDKQAAEAVREYAEAAPAPIVVLPKEVPKGGTAIRKHWKFRIIDEALIPRQYLIPDEKAIGAHGRSLEDKASIAGVEFYSTESEGVL